MIGRRPGRRATAPAGPPPPDPGPAPFPGPSTAAPQATDDGPARHTAPVSDTLAPGSLTDSGALTEPVRSPTAASGRPWTC